MVRRILALLVFLGCAAGVHAQINPLTQIQWPLTTGTGAPTSSCTDANKGQPYTDTANSVDYTCGGTATGWFASSGTPGISSVEGTAPIQVNGDSGVPHTGAVIVSCAGGSCSGSGGSTLVLQNPVQQGTGPNVYYLTPSSCSASFSSGLVAECNGNTGAIVGAAGGANIDWTNFNFAGTGIPSGSINSLYAIAISSSSRYDAFGITNFAVSGGGLSCSGSSASMFIPTFTGGFWTTSQVSHACTPPTTWTSVDFNISGVRALGGQEGFVNVNGVYLEIDYTGSAVPVPNSINVGYPLNVTNGVVSITNGWPVYIQSSTIAVGPFQLPPATGLNAGYAYLVQDATVAGSCGGSGGGSGNPEFCYSNGAAYVGIPLSGGGGGGFTAGGDLSGSSTSQTVIGLRGISLPSAATGYLYYNGIAYTYQTPAGAGTVTTTGSPISGQLTKFSGPTSITNANATDLLTAMQSATNCNLSGYAASPQAGGCIAVTGLTNPMFALGQMIYSTNTSGTPGVVAAASGTDTSVPQVLVETPGGAPAFSRAGTTGRTVTGTTDTIAAADRATLVTYTSSSATAVSLTSAATLGTNFTFAVRNTGTGTVTITPTAGTIDSTTDSAGSSIALSPQQWCVFNSPDNVNYTGRCSVGSTGSTINMTGDTVSSGTLPNVTSVTSKVNGGALPASKAFVGTNSSSQITDASTTYGTNSAKGIVQCDGTTISCSGGVISQMSGVRPAIMATTFVGVPANSQILYYVPAAIALTVPSSCATSQMKAAVAATSSTVFLVNDLTTSTTLCTATFSASGTVAVFTGSGGTISPGDIIEIVGPATADATLATIGASIYATR